MAVRDFTSRRKMHWNVFRSRSGLTTDGKLTSWLIGMGVKTHGDLVTVCDTRHIVPPTSMEFDKFRDVVTHQMCDNIPEFISRVEHERVEHERVDNIKKRHRKRDVIESQ